MSERPEWWESSLVRKVIKKLLDRRDRDEAKIDRWYGRKLYKMKKFYADGLITSDEYDDRKWALDDKREEKINKIFRRYLDASDMLEKVVEAF